VEWHYLLGLISRKRRSVMIQKEDVCLQLNVDKSFNQSFKNFIPYLPKFKKVTIWDNSKDFGFKSMVQQLIFENGKLTVENPNLTDYSKQLLKEISDYNTKGCRNLPTH
jgi:hypothetical protein